MDSFSQVALKWRIHAAQLEGLEREGPPNFVMMHLIKGKSRKSNDTTS